MAAALIVAASIASLKVTVTTLLAATPPAPLAGVNAVTAGGVVSGAAAVVNDTVLFAARALPAKSLTRGSVLPPRTVSV
jgi:hypothetical protein